MTAHRILNITLAIAGAVGMVYRLSTSHLLDDHSSRLESLHRPGRRATRSPHRGPPRARRRSVVHQAARTRHRLPLDRRPAIWFAPITAPAAPPWWWPAKGCTVTKPHATRWPDGTPRSTANAFEWRERQAAGIDSIIAADYTHCTALYNAWRSDQRSGHGKGAHMTWAQYRATQTPKTKSFAHRDPAARKRLWCEWRHGARLVRQGRQDARGPGASCCQSRATPCSKARCCHRAPCARCRGREEGGRMTTALHQLPAIVLAFITLAALLAIGVLIWQALPRRNARERDIERQIATLRKGADHAVQHRPRVRAGGYQP